MEAKEEAPVKSGEQLLFEEYLRLGVEGSALEKRRKEIRDTDIEPLMEQGVVLGNGSKMLCFEFEHRATFEWERAAKDGKIPKDVLKEYLRLTPMRKIVSRDIEPKGKPANDARLKAMAYGPDLLTALEDWLLYPDNADARTTLDAVIARAKGEDEEE